MNNPVHDFYGNRLRVRVCGLCVMNDQLLLVNHRMSDTENLWSPPGGGIEFGESVTECLVREFQEETGLRIETLDFLFTAELIKPPLHAIELFFSVKLIGGSLKTGSDPEMAHQIIQEAKFVGWNELKGWKKDNVHGIFQKVDEPVEIMSLRGYFKL